MLIMRYLTLKIRLLALLLLSGTCAAAQPTPAELAAHPERSAGIYHSYEYLPGPDVPIPAGYEPFYISHYGRHGSRYHSKEKAYAQPLDVLRRAAEAGKLTPKGQEVLAKAEALAEDARLRYGDLSPRGVAEHRGIAERMYAAWPGVFSTDGGRVCRVESRSTLVPRCILSMAAFNERLKELNPAISTTRDASGRYLDYMARGNSQALAREAIATVADSLSRARLNPDRLVRSLVTDSRVVADPLELMQDLFLLAGIVQDVSHLGIEPFYDIFTDEELYSLWECENALRYMQMGPSARFGGPIVADAGALLRNIVETADKVVRGESGLSASLRFGHDTCITPMLALLGVEGASTCVESLDDIAVAWNAQTVTPMGTNIQFVFFRNPATGDVRVRVLHNERDARLPISGGPYYPWAELKKYCESLYE